LAEKTARPQKKLSAELRSIKAIESKVDRLAYSLEKSGIQDYLEYRSNPRKMLKANFLSGLARGFGMAVGFTILGAIVIWILQRAVFSNIPLIGNFVADIVEIVKEKM
jgi:hypothetical protein